MIGLHLDDIVVDGWITKAPCGGEKAGRSPVDRGKHGLKRSTLADGRGVPLHLVSAGAHRHDAPLLAPTLDSSDPLRPLPADVTAHLDRGSTGAPTRTLLDGQGIAGRFPESRRTSWSRFRPSSMARASDRSWLRMERLLAAYRTGDSGYLSQIVLADHRTRSLEQAEQMLEQLQSGSGYADHRLGKSLQAGSLVS